MIITLGVCGPALLTAACFATAAASAPAQTSRPKFATAIFLSDWDRWSADAVRKLKNARILDSSEAAAADNEARAVSREIQRLDEVTSVEAAVDSRPAERAKRSVGAYEERLGDYVEKGVRTKQNRIVGLSELKDLRDLLAVRVEAAGERRKRILAIDDRLKILRARVTPAVRSADIRAPQITPFLDMTEDLGLCSDALRRAAEDETDVHKRLTRLLAAYDEAIAVYRS